MEKLNDENIESTITREELEKIKDEIKNNPSLIKNEEYQIHELCMEAVNEDGLMLEYIKEQTSDICETAIRNNPYSIKFAQYQSPGMCEHSVFLVPELIEYTKFQTLDMCKKAINSDVHLIKNIKEPQLIIWIMAALKNKQSIKWIKDRNMKKRVDALIKSFEMVNDNDSYYLEQCLKNMDFEQLSVFNEILKENYSNIKINEMKNGKMKELIEYYLDEMTPSLGSSIIDEDKL